jgi:hypothetical protein
MKVPRIIGKSFELWIANPIIIVPFLLQFLSYVVLTLLFGIFLFSQNWESLMAEDIEAIATQLITKFFESSLNLLIFAVLVALAVFLSCFLLSGSIGIANEIAKGKKAKFRDMTDYGKRFWLPYLGTSVLIVLIMIFALIIGASVFLAVSMIGLSDIAVSIATAIFALLVLLFAVLLVPATSLLIVQNSKPVEAIKMSFKLSKRNYMPLLGLILLLVVINIFINLIPSVGGIIGFLILNPIQTLSIVLFVIDRLPGLRQSIKRKKK